jgi:biotin operon repressor
VTADEKREFKGLFLTPDIMAIKSINMLEKVIITDVLYFPNSFRFSDEKLAKKYGAGRRTITRTIKRLRSEAIGLLVKVGEDKYHRCLKINKDKLTLLINKTKDKEAILSGEKQKESRDNLAVTKDKMAIQSRDKQADIDKHIRTTLDKHTTSEADALRLAELLLSLILERKIDFKRPDVSQWAKSIDCMLRLDKRSPERIEAVIRWCQADNGNGQWRGWQDNILSTAKVRQKFDKLELDMRKDENRSDKIRNDSAGLGSVARAGEFIR